MISKREKLGIFRVIIMTAACLLIAAAASGCLGTEYTVEGKIMTEDGSQPFDNADIYIELMDMTDPENLIILKRMTLENGSSTNYTYNLTHDIRLEPKGIYTITAHIDMDGDGKVSDGDYVSKALFRLEPNMIEQPFDVYVYPFEM